MALLPNTIVYGTTGDDSSPVEKRNGGTVVGVTSSSDLVNGPITQAFPLTSNAITLAERGTRVQELSGAAHASSATKADSGGTFAYKQVQFMIRTVATQVNGQSNTVLQINGLPSNRPHTLISNKSKGAKTSTAHRSGYWRGVGISGQRTNWSSAPATNNVNYVLPTNNGSNASDQGQFVTYRSIPGELAYMYGAIDAQTADYPAK
jgi:hypothetical protein